MLSPTPKDAGEKACSGCLVAVQPLKAPCSEDDDAVSEAAGETEDFLGWDWALAACPHARRWRICLQIRSVGARKRHLPYFINDFRASYNRDRPAGRPGNSSVLLLVLLVALL
eukprot:3939355-Rhodomonas_salina.3